QREDRTHRGALPDDSARDVLASIALLEVRVLALQLLVGPPELLHETRVLALEAIGLDRPAQRDAQLLMVPGLGHVAIDAARVNRLDEHVDVAVARQDNAH